MMTPEERQRTMDFILASQAKAEVRMDRLAEESARQKEQSARQKEVIDGLVKVSQALLKVSANVVERTKRLETRAGSVDEMLKILRELMEANLHPPDDPIQNKS
jgi:hypothetical protein